MKIEHRLRAYGLCPVDDAVDAYDVIVRCQRMIRVEDILAALSDLTKEPIFQESLTSRLAQRLGAEVETIGYHSGVQTKVVV